MAFFSMQVLRISRGRSSSGIRPAARTNARAQSGLARDAFDAIAYRGGWNLTNPTYRSWEKADLAKLRVQTRKESLRRSRLPVAAAARGFRAVIGADPALGPRALWKAVAARSLGKESATELRLTLLSEEGKIGHPAIAEWVETAAVRLSADGGGLVVEAVVTPIVRGTTVTFRMSHGALATAAGAGPIPAIPELATPAAARKWFEVRRRRLSVQFREAASVVVAPRTVHYKHRRTVGQRAQRQGLPAVAYSAMVGVPPIEPTMPLPEDPKQHALARQVAAASRLAAEIERTAPPRRDALLGRDFVLSLPWSLGKDGWRAIADNAAKLLHAELGVAVVVAVHRPTGPAEVGERNAHVHLMVTRYPIDRSGRLLNTAEAARAAGFGRVFEVFERGRGLAGREMLKRIRRGFGDIVNAQLKAAKSTDRVEARSFADRGLLRLPLPSLTMRQRKEEERRGFLRPTDGLPLPAATRRGALLLRTRRWNERLARRSEALAEAARVFRAETGLTPTEYAQRRQTGAVALDPRGERILRHRRQFASWFPPKYQMPWRDEMRRIVATSITPATGTGVRLDRVRAPELARER